MRRLLLVASLSLAAGTVGAQNTDQQLTGELADILNGAREKGLPTDPIVAKARQGLLFKSPTQKIVAAAQAVSHRLEEARDALGPATPADISAGQDALSVPGVTKDMLRAIRRERPARPIVVPIALLAQLVANGVKPTEATKVVADLVRGNATDRQLVDLGDNVIRDVHSGAAAEKALTVRLQPLKPLLSYSPAQAAAAAAIDGLTSGADPRSKPPRP